MERNKSHENGAGFSLGCEECSDSKESFGTILRNNWAYDNIGPALVLVSGIGSNPIKDVGISDNTFYHNYKKG